MISAALLGLLAAGPELPPDLHNQKVFVGWDATTKACVPQVNGVETGDVSTGAGQAALVAALPDRGGTIGLIGKDGLTIPYSCIADIITTLKHNGFYGRIGFVSGAPGR